MLIPFLLTALIVGFVTAGLNIRFDRFFTILLLLFLFKYSIHKAVDIFLWVMMFGSLIVILDNKETAFNVIRKMKSRFLIYIPLMTMIFSFVGTILFVYFSSEVLLITLGILAFLYGIRLVIVHFEEYELNFEKGHPKITKICGVLGPIISGFFIGFIGTSLKPLKMAFAVKVGRMNSKQVYLGNVITAFLSSVFAIFWHNFLGGYNVNIFYDNMILGLALIMAIHIIFEITNTIFKDKWRTPFQVIIGLILVLVSIKIFFIV